MINLRPNAAQRERLILLTEECSEVIHIISKILRHGYSSTDPTSHLDINNRTLLCRELGDLLWSLDLMLDRGDVTMKMILLAKQKKRERMQSHSYLHFNRVK